MAPRREIRRLRHVLRASAEPSAGGTALRAVGAAAAEPAVVLELGADDVDLSAIHDRLAAAVATQDFAAAAQLQQALRCLTPAPAPLSPAAGTDAATVAAQKAFMDEHGFLVVPLYAGDALARLQASWRRVQEPAVREWAAAKRQGVGIKGHGFANSPLGSTQEFCERGTPVTFRGRLLARRWMDIPAQDFFAESCDAQGDDILLGLVDHPLLVPVLRAYLGDEVQLAGVSPRTYPSHPDDDDEGSCTFWHRDGSKPDGYTEPTDAHDLKVFVNLADIPADGGCTAVVPRTHKLRSMPHELFGARAFSRENGTGVNLERMPNAMPFAVPAGTACIFDTACWHTAMNNTSAVDRQSVILGYNCVVPRRNTGELIPPAMLERLESVGRMESETRRQILGFQDGALLGQRGDWRGLYDE